MVIVSKGCLQNIVNSLFNICWEIFIFGFFKVTLNLNAERGDKKKSPKAYYRYDDGGFFRSRQSYALNLRLPSVFYYF